DITFGHRAEESVSERMHADIGVAVADERLRVRNADAAKDHRVARTESMHVVAGSHALRAERSLRPKPQELVGARDLLCRSELAIGFGAFDQDDVEAVPLPDTGVVGEAAAVFRRGAMRGEDRFVTEALRRLRAPQIFTGKSACGTLASSHGQSIGDR